MKVGGPGLGEVRREERRVEVELERGHRDHGREEELVNERMTLMLEVDVDGKSAVEDPPWAVEGALDGAERPAVFAADGDLAIAGEQRSAEAEGVVDLLERS
jgi:hypothetical protein